MAPLEWKSDCFIAFQTPEELSLPGSEPVLWYLVASPLGNCNGSTVVLSARARHGNRAWRQRQRQGDSGEMETA